MGESSLLEVEAMVKDFDGVGAGEDEPAVVVEAGEGVVEERVGFGRGDLDRGYEDGVRAKGFELGGEVRGLVACARDEDAFVFELEHLTTIVVRGDDYDVERCGDDDSELRRYFDFAGVTRLGCRAMR